MEKDKKTAKDAFLYMEAMVYNLYVIHLMLKTVV